MLLYELAYSLHQPLEYIKAMPYETLLGWMSFFEKRPEGWRDDDRAMKYLQTQGVEEKPWTIFPSLRPIYGEDEDRSIGAKLSGSGFMSFIREAKGGDTIC